MLSLYVKSKPTRPEAVCNPHIRQQREQVQQARSKQRISTHRTSCFRNKFSCKHNAPWTVMKNVQLTLLPSMSDTVTLI